MGPEAKLQTRCLNRLRKMQEDGEKLWWSKIVGSPLQKRGTPDLLICRNGKLIAIEFKGPDGVISAMQAVEHRKIKTAGGICEVVRTVEEFQEIVG